jgi:hypothetical protein
MMFIYKNFTNTGLTYSPASSKTAPFPHHDHLKLSDSKCHYSVTSIRSLQYLYFHNLKLKSDASGSFFKNSETHPLSLNDVIAVFYVK